MLRIEIINETCGDNEVISMDVPLDTDKMDIMGSIQCLYPTAWDIHMYVVDKPVD